MTDTPSSPQDSVSREVVVRNRYGIHARPAALLAKTASAYAADIYLAKDGAEVSAKSVMGVLTLEGCPGSKIRISARGPDAAEAVDALAKLFELKFFEDREPEGGGTDGRVGG
ncbi:MAG: HPr family phosphocarrier protein [Kiritimatiellae bacterium]|nr:HPr family phosphocarrier protein [Kiritimatiellia bacterium]